jgi:hypothetical protein
VSIFQHLGQFNQIKKLRVSKLETDLIKLKNFQVLEKLSKIKKLRVSKLKMDLVKLKTSKSLANFVKKFNR